jgi:hypothetical protein
MFLLLLFNRANARVRAMRSNLRDSSSSGIALLGIVFIIYPLIFVLVLQATLEKEAPILAFIVCLTLGFVALISAIGASWDPGTQSIKEYILSFRGTCIIAVAMVASIAAITGIITLFDPRPATQKDVKQATQAVADVDNKVDELSRILRARFPEKPPILTEIAGRWGEPGTCALVWDIAIIQRGEDAALVAEIIKRPEGVEPFRLLAEIIEAQGYALDTVGEEPARARGRAAVFTLNPATQRLVWDDKSSQGGVEEYVRCSAD